MYIYIIYIYIYVCVCVYIYGDVTKVVRKVNNNGDTKLQNDLDKLVK